MMINAFVQRRKVMTSEASTSDFDLHTHESCVIF